MKKVFPDKCPKCKKWHKYETLKLYKAKIKHNGIVYSFQSTHIEVSQCFSCNEIFYCPKSNKQMREQLYAYSESLN